MQIEHHKVWRIALRLYPDIHPSKLNQEQRAKITRVCVIHSYSFRQ